MSEVRRLTLWMVSESGCELEPYSEESPEGKYILASDYDQLKADYAEIESALVTKNHEAHDLEIENRQLKFENERLAGCLQKWTDVFGHLGDTPDEVGNLLISEQDRLQAQLDEAMKLLTRCYMERDTVELVSAVNAWLEAHGK